MDCVFLFWPDTLKFFYVNKGASEQVGYTAEELLNMTPLDIKPKYDEPGFREFVHDAASGMGFEVQMASNGGKAKDVYEAFDPDIIVLDIVMPEVDGIEFTRWLAQRKTRSRIVLVTGYNPNYAESATKLAEALGLPDITFLTKPVRLSTLAETLTGTQSADEVAASH